MVHIAVVGNGRIGRPTAYTLLNEKLADEISLVDTKPGQAWAFGEELKHVAASLRHHVTINTYARARIDEILLTAVRAPCHSLKAHPHTSPAKPFSILARIFLVRRQ